MNSISLFVTEQLQVKDTLKIRLTDLGTFFCDYVCAYYFVTNKDIDLKIFLNERAGGKEKNR